MATLKQSRPKAQPRTKSVPVRVLPASRKPRPPAIAPENTAPQSSIRATPPVRSGVSARSGQVRDRRSLMWLGVVSVMIVIVIVWILTLGWNLSKTSGSDSLLGKIRTELTNFFSRFGSKKETNVNAEDKALQDLRNRVFPEVRDQEFQTDTGNTNNTVNVNSTNTNQTANVNQ